MSSIDGPVSCPSSPLSFVNNSMDLDAFFSVTRDNTDFSKACSLVKTNQIAYIKDELLHQLNISIHYHKTEIARQWERAQQILTKHFSQPTTIDKHAYLVNKFERRQLKKDWQLQGLRRPYVKKPYYTVSPLSILSSSSELSPSIHSHKTISRYLLDGEFIHHYVQPVPTASETACHHEQFFNNISPICRWTSPTVWQERTQPKVETNTFTFNWINYQGGSGSHLNPIVIEDDWFDESKSLVGGIVTSCLVFYITISFFDSYHWLMFDTLF